MSTRTLNCICFMCRLNAQLFFFRDLLLKTTASGNNAYEKKNNKVAG